MVIGDPFDFAIRFDLVDDWNDMDANGEFTWVSGFYEIYIDGVKYPDYITQTEFRTNLFYLFNDVYSRMNRVTQKDLIMLSSPSLNVVEDMNVFFVEKKILTLSSSDIEDEGARIYFFFNNKNDFILLRTENTHKIIKYKKGGISGILEKLRYSRESRYIQSICLTKPEDKVTSQVKV